ncbi:hypothetical protein DP116_18575 [Brasilonema bromeliae SPC951]|uniref:Uncharacterized protein n=1 Tax=Brasilonema bromeliae SPC951 TaxID=385972 RepID=A0ABX1PA96_9CYAN|nr:hypothetical protein [Brasilonema bromeliae SPC951]
MGNSAESVKDFLWFLCSAWERFLEAPPLNNYIEAEPQVMHSLPETRNEEILYLLLLNAFI